MDIAGAHDGGEGAALTAATTKAGYVDWRQPDYAWTHSTPVEGFFVVLTIVIVPVAILRWLRRLPSLSLVEGSRRRHGANT